MERRLLMNVTTYILTTNDKIRLDQMRTPTEKLSKLELQGRRKQTYREDKMSPRFMGCPKRAPSRKIFEHAKSHLIDDSAEGL